MRLSQLLYSSSSFSLSLSASLLLIDIVIIGISFKNTGFTMRRMIWRTDDLTAGWSDGRTIWKMGALTDRRADGRTRWQTDATSFRDGWSHKKIVSPYHHDARWLCRRHRHASSSALIPIHFERYPSSHLAGVIGLCRKSMSILSSLFVLLIVNLPILKCLFFFKNASFFGPKRRYRTTDTSTDETSFRDAL